MGGGGEGDLEEEGDVVSWVILVCQEARGGRGYPRGTFHKLPL